MAKRTLLEMTQGILSGMESDSVNDIGDTIEATMVAEMIRRVYFDLIDDLELPNNSELVALEGLADTDKPTHMHMPDNVSRIEWIKYDTRRDVSDPKNYRDIPFKHPYEFLNIVLSRDSTDTTNNQVVQYSANIPIIIDITKPASCWTSFDDEFIVFDSFDQNVEATMQASKVLCGAAIRPTFTLSNDFIPDLPENLFSLLYATSEAMCHVFHKQLQNPRAEQIEHRLRVRSQRNKWRQQRKTYEGPDYGRRC